MIMQHAKNPVSRRQFLKQATVTAGALALPTIVPSSVFGANAPSQRVNLAMIGVGGRGSAVMNGFIRYDDVQFVAVADTYRDRRERAQAQLNKRYGDHVVKAYADFRDVLKRDDVDGVVVCTPDHWHVPVALYAARAGKDMYVEKPLGVSMAWAGTLRKAIRRFGNVFQYGTQQRSGSNFRLACELVRNGYIGDVKRVEAWCPDISEQFNAFQVKQYGSTASVPAPLGLDYEMWTGPAPMRPYTVDRCTCYGTYHCYDYALGFIAGWGAHPLDIAQWGMALDHTSPVLYEGTGALPTRGLYDTISQWDMHCKYANGLPLRFMSERTAKSVVMSYRQKWVSHGTTFFGEEGWISVDRTGWYTNNPLLKRVQLTAEEVHLYNSPAQDRNFVDCMKTRRPTISPLESAIRSDTISHMSDLCIRLGRRIKWDPKKEVILSDMQANRLLNRTMRRPWSL
jgi:predicted dehydrogenase